MIRHTPTRYRQTLIGALFAAACFAFFHFALPYHLFFKEQMQLFLFTKDYFVSYLGQPAWLASYAGDFLTQFFYLRGGGAFTLALALTLEYALAVGALRSLGVRRYASRLALLPAVAGALLHSSLYYGLPATVSVVLALLAFRMYTWIRRPVWAFAAGLLCLPLLYSLAGASFFLFAVLAGAYAWRQGGRRRGLCALALLGAAGLYPAAVRAHYLQTPAQAYRSPFPSSLHLREAVAGRERLLALAVEAGRGNWAEVGRRAAAFSQPHPVRTYYAHIAASKEGRLPERLLTDYLPQAGGLFLPVHPQAGWLTIFFSSEVFYHLGDLNLAQHSAMLGMIFSPRRRSSAMLRRLAEINLAGGDTAVARKYLRMLEATLFHRRWAVKRRQAPQQGHPLIERDMFRTASDYVAGLEWLAENRPAGHPALDYLLCYHLLQKDIPAFTGAFDRYAEARTPGSLPRLYAEALLIKLAATRAPAQELRRYGIPDERVAAFMDYTRLYEQSRGTAAQLRERFGDSYWFYYHFAQHE